MEKKIIVISFILVLILLVPIKLDLRDGGSKEYKSLTYSISKVHRYVFESEMNEYVKPYEDGIIIKVLGVEIYNNIEK